MWYRELRYVCEGQREREVANRQQKYENVERKREKSMREIGIESDKDSNMKRKRDGGRQRREKERWREIQEEKEIKIDK